MKFLLLVFSICFSFSSFADYKIVSLYEKDALVTGRFLPFKVYDDKNQAIGIVGVAPSELCYGMVDTFRDTVFHIYCLEETTASAQLILKNGDIVSLANLPIRKLSIIEPDIQIGPKEPSLVKIGEREFNNNCMGCHASNPIKKKQTKDTLVNTQFKKDVMKQFGVDSSTGKGFFTDKELEGIVLYINEVLL